MNSEPLKLPEVLNAEVFNQNNHMEEFREDLNLFIQKSKALDSKCQRIAKN